MTAKDPVFGPDDVPEITRLHRLQWEEAQQAWVILYPEGMVKLNGAAGEIMKRVDGNTSVAGIIKLLKEAFPGVDLAQDVVNFLEVAHERGWIRPKTQ